MEAKAEHRAERTDNSCQGQLTYTLVLCKFQWRTPAEVILDVCAGVLRV